MRSSRNFESTISICTGAISIISIYLGVRKSYLEPKNINSGQESFSFSIPRENRDTCTIYTVKIGSRKDVYDVKEILKKLDWDRFLSKVGESDSQFIRDVKGACLDSKKHIKNGRDRRVYVYQDGGKWIYSSNLQGRDWIKKFEVKVPDNIGRS